LLYLKEDALIQEAWVPELAIEHHPDATKSRSQYLPLLELGYKEAPTNDRNVHYLAREYFFTGQYQKAIDMFFEHLELPTAVWDEERCASYRYIAKSYKALGNMNAAIKMFEYAIEECPTVREPSCELGILLAEMNNNKDAYHAFRKALLIPPRELYSYLTVESYQKWLPEDYLCKICWDLGYHDEAAEYARRAYMALPTDERIRKNYEFFTANFNKG
jgi:tetratricopeptide (TPR) repeat protein